MPIQPRMMNALFAIKGKISDYIPSLKATFTQQVDGADDNKAAGLEAEIFSHAKLYGTDTPDVIVNIMKSKDPEVMKTYVNEVVWNMFPTIGSKIVIGGSAKSEYWDQVSQCWQAMGFGYRKMFLDIPDWFGTIQEQSQSL